MSASTESLIKLRNATSECRSYANVSVPTNAPRKYKSEHSFNIRINRVDAIQGAEFASAYNFKCPSFGQCIGEMWLEFDLPALADAQYRENPLLHVVERVDYRLGQRFYTFYPSEDIPILLSKCRNREMKDQLLKMFADPTGAASGNGGKYILPLVTPFSVWQTDKICAPMRHGNRGGSLLDTSVFNGQDLVIEVTIAAAVDCTSSAGPTFTAASNLGNATLRWEEVVAAPAVLQAIRASIPKTRVCNEYTRLDEQACDSSTKTTYKAASLISRAGVSGFVFRTYAAADVNKCMVGDAELGSLVVNADGRDIFDTDGRSAQQTDYQRILAGDFGDLGVGPKFAHWDFGNQHHNFEAGTTGSLLKNGTVNELNLDITCAAGSDRIDIIAVHPRKFTLTSQGVKVSNCY